MKPSRAVYSEINKFATVWRDEVTVVVEVSKFGNGLDFQVIFLQFHLLDKTGKDSDCLGRMEQFQFGQTP
jgi:hypothetical protein